MAFMMFSQLSLPKGDSSFHGSDLQLFETGHLADATIVCGDRTWKVHKLILGTRCKWFKVAFYGNMAESASSEVVLHEQDPELVDILLRFIYAKDIDIRKLSDGKRVPLLCVRLVRLADFFLLDELRTKAIDGLQFHFNTTLFRIPDADPYQDSSPPWLVEVLDAVEEAYKDTSTLSTRSVLMTFVHKNGHIIFNYTDAINLLDRHPLIVQELKRLYPHFNLPLPLPEQATVRSRQQLGVLAAFQAPSSIYTAGDGKLLLYPANPFDFTNLDSVFLTVSSETDLVVTSLAWLAPSARIVKMITLHPDSVMVQLRMQADSGRVVVLYIKFSSHSDALLYVERYCLVNPNIIRFKAPSWNTLSPPPGTI